MNSDDRPRTPLPPITNKDIGYTIHDTCWRCETTNVQLYEDPMVRDSIGICASCVPVRHRIKSLIFSIQKVIRKGGKVPPPIYNENNPPFPTK